jgi:aspartyl-tRNA(Asn)/glutamyl-tRNA(Gln) amidotransferase subunit A
MNLSHLTIGEAHKQLRAKKISAVELMESFLERIGRVDGTLNAVVHKNFERALTEAKSIDERGVFDTPLQGVPYLSKDVFSEKGVPTTACSHILRNKDYVSPFDSTTTKRLKAAGAISLGKTNTDEFTMGASTETSCFGVTKNPWDTTRVAGGSSGGSAAAVSADECVFALGTDTGGSIRQPAAYCSVVGLRPTYGRTSRYGVLSMASSLDTIGPMNKTVEDAALVLEAIAGHDPMDGTTSLKPVEPYSQRLSKSLKGVTVGVPKEYVIDGMDPEMLQNLEDAKRVLVSLGATLKDISLPHTKYALATYYVLCPSEVSSNMARYDGIRFGKRGEKHDLQSHYESVRGEGFGSEVKRRIMIGTYALSSGYFDAYYLKAQKVRTLIRKDFENAFQSVDVIISPVTPTPAFTVGAHNDDPVAMYLEDAFMDGAVMAGVPALSVPAGFSTKGLPIGLQIMGPQWGESAILSAAYAYEQATKWYEKKPSI